MSTGIIEKHFHRFTFSGLYIIGCIIVFVSSGVCEPLSAIDRTDTPKPVSAAVVLEVFTSEHCARCLRVQEVVSSLERSQQQAGNHVYPLFFHVDYLNSSQWRDDLGRLLFTERQRAYGQKLKSEPVEGGQVIVNGRWVLLGDNLDKLNRNVQRALVEPEKAKILVNAAIAGSQQWQLNYQVEYPQPLARDYLYMHAALVQDSVRRYINGGPLSGRTIIHHNVVREFQTRRVALKDAQGEFVIGAEAELQDPQLRAVIYLQDPESGTILGAGEVKLSGK